MQDQKKVYGFTISIFEFIETIPTLWDAVKDFMRQHPEYVAEGNSMDFISDDGGETYNKCHSDLNFWRSEAYMDFYTHLEQTGGFWYERWVSIGCAAAEYS
ncbi:alpha-1,2-mannosyltransferase KRE2 [Naganishia cerealis]|uniref:Alpha-1,2-mannosyltransferase KRE2 n=1 Tax=Naganishia cerealis TaxID=610337 RepID=A0ACC2W056_9TREE|nr:alpha-1,2-mannosyltransferase KRE2 [Naganishia cerealis]